MAWITAFVKASAFRRVLKTSQEMVSSRHIMRTGKRRHVWSAVSGERRELFLRAVSQLPADTWVAQQIREATPRAQRPRYILHDRDSKYGLVFRSLLQATGIEEIKTPYRTPKTNGAVSRAKGLRHLSAGKSFSRANHLKKARMDRNAQAHPPGLRCSLRLAR